LLLLPKAGQVLHTLLCSYLYLEDKGVGLPLPSDSVIPRTSNSFVSKELSLSSIYFLNYYSWKWAWKHFQREWDVTVAFGLRYLWFTPQHQNKVCHGASGSYPLAAEEEILDRKSYTEFFYTEW